MTLASLDGANFSGADLEGADLSGVHIDRVNLTGANLDEAIMIEASLIDSDLSKASLDGTDVKGMLFQPKDLPTVDNIAYAKNLSEIVYADNPRLLVKLRNAFKESGYKEQESAITYAIKHTETTKLLKRGDMVATVEGMFRYFFFDLTTRWGMSPGRALVILLMLIPVFAIFYIIALLSSGEDGIWRKWLDDRMRLDLGAKEPERLHVGWIHSLIIGLYFSVLSAFNIGWRQINVGNWIQRLQPREYILRATGWVRTVSSVQALISVYLFAIWALTYFGRPFE